MWSEGLLRTPPPRSAKPRGGDETDLVSYLIEVKDRSQSAMYGFATPWTFLERTSVVLSQMNGMPAASWMIILSMFAHAWRRWSPSSSAALFMAASILGSLSIE